MQTIVNASSPGTVRLDSSNSEWPVFVMREILEPWLARGFDGWVIEGLDKVERTQAQSLLRMLVSSHGDKTICVRDLIDLATEAAGAGLYLEGTLDQMDALLPKLRAPLARGTRVLVRGFSSSAEQQLNDKFAAAWAKAGASVFVTARDASGVSLAPMRELRRRVLVLYGWDPAECGKPGMVPADTMTAELLQTPIEWLGLECDFCNVATQGLPRDIAARCAAVIVDGEMLPPAGRELGTAEWLAAAKRANVPVFFLGGMPFASDDAVRVIGAAFGLRGSLQVQPRISDVSVTAADDKRLNFETKILPRLPAFRDLQAPEDAKVLVELTGQAEDQRTLHFTPLFHASWGGAWMEPFVVLRASQDSNLFYADPYGMIEPLLVRRGALPAPDTTTRDGRRLFYSHVDGDGFASVSDFKGHPLCAEIVRERILKTFPFPVTVSVIEADIRALAEGIPDEWQPRIEGLARDIFTLPNVQPASHSFSHPYCWDLSDPNPGEYSEPNLPLKAAAAYPEINAEREVRGSVEYINRELCPRGKPVELMLWSGNCRPGAAALRICREMHLENMNGGDTVVSRLYPGSSGVAPRVTSWDGELQINAANQNEFMYANGWNGPFYGGFARVTDTFERTESPRRVKPVNVYYHFYSAMNLSSLRALESIYRWCSDRDLHPVTALQFAQTTRDAWRTRVFELEQRHWLISNNGHCRTLRMPLSAGIPDMKRCKGITGWLTHQDCLYIHTNGTARCELVLRDASPEPFAAADAALYLGFSSEEIAFEDLSQRRAAFHLRGWRAAHVDFGGLPANAAIPVQIDSRTLTFSTDGKGHLTLNNLPANARVVVDATQVRYADTGR